MIRMVYSGNTNLAYDLSLFDTQERDRRAERRRAEDEKRRIRLAPALSVSRGGSKFKLIVSALAIFAALFLVNFYNTKRDDVSRQVEVLESELASVKDDNDLLRGKLDSKINIGYIEKYAAENLGMTKISSSQKKYIGYNPESLIEVDKDESAGFIGAVKNWFSDLMEYIGL